MIDIHAHLMPGVDDGPENDDEVAPMLQVAVEDGIEQMAATPHVHSTLCRYASLDELKKHRELFFRHTMEIQVKPTLVFGAEVHLGFDLPDLLSQHHDLLTLNNSSYVLVEFPTEILFPRSQDLLHRIMLEGYIPVIAHPERNEIIQRNIKPMLDFVGMGALCQVDAGSLTGDFGDFPYQAAIQLIEANAVHAVASDAHDCEDRPPRLSSARRVLDRVGEERLNLIFHAIPLAILQNETIPDIGPVGGRVEEVGWLRRVRRWFT